MRKCFESIYEKSSYFFWRKKLNEIELKARNIIESSEGIADKQQELINLTKKLKLPIHSSDVHCRILSYPELFHQIEQWVNLKRNESLAKRIVTAAWFSAIMATIAVVSSICIYWQTRQLLKPTERPIISAVDSKCKGDVNEDTSNLEIALNLVIKNIGKHPAKNMKVTVWGAPLDEPNNLKICRDFTLADNFFPNIQLTLSNKISVQIKSYDRLKDQRKKVFLYIKMDYEDAFMKGIKYNQGFHMIYEIGKSNMTGATLEEKKKFDVYLIKVGAIS